MLFNSLVFLFLFLPVAYCVFWALRTAQSRYIWLAITGYVFYGYWDPRFCLLMAFSTLVSYLAGIGFLYVQSARGRKWLLILPITADLCLLGYFKYANFFLENVGKVLEATGQSIELPILNVVLPVGISFYTFHTISYIVDCYRRTIKPTRNLYEFAAYVSLFSQLVAGPIVRFGQIEKDLESLGVVDRTQWLAKGIAFFLTGMLEKVLIADSLAAWVDPAWAQIADLSTLSTWLAVFGYSFQLYFDFCGYSNMAIGLGFMFGLRIPKNFDSPYKALDPSDFWKRWHISLSTCLRDYLYIPLGGNRNGVWQTNRNLLLTMLLGGMWHGANWTFILWGFYHGILLILHRFFSAQWNVVPTVFRQVAMFLVVSIGWVFFRSPDSATAFSVLGNLYAFEGGIDLGSLGLIIISLVVAICLGMVLPNSLELFREYKWRTWHASVFACLFGVSLALIIGGGDSPFLYFQF